MFVLVYIPQFRLVAARRLMPQTSRATVLAESLGRQSKVVEVDAVAQAAGVAAGMPVPQALSRCPGALVLPASANAEALAGQTLLHAAFDIAPRVECVHPGCCLIDVRGRKKEQVSLAVAVALAALQQQDLPTRAGIAPTPGLATFAARATNSLLIVEDAAAFLAATPIAAAAPSPELADIFRQWGIQTLGMLADLSRESLAHRFGPEAISLWDACHGRDKRPLDIMELPPDYRESMELDYAIETLEPLLFIIRRLLDSICMRLERRHCTAVQIILTLHLDDRTDFVFDCKLPEPTQQAGVLFRTIQAHLEQVRTEAPVTALVLELAAERAQVKQQGLFDTTLKDPARFADTLDRLAGIVGAENVGTPRLEDTHEPDSIRMERLPQVIAPPVRIPAHLRGRGLPLRRCRPPIPAYVRMAGESLAHVSAGSIDGEVVDAAGPFTSSSRWWEAALAWEREEWDVELPDGHLLRLLHCKDAWFIEGRYE